MLALQANALFAQPAMPAHRDIDYGTIAAYESLGAAYVGWTKDELVPIRMGAEEGFPGFYFRFATNQLASSKLPQVPVPFVLCLSVGKDDLKTGLKELAGLRNLVALSLEGKGVSDSGLKETLDSLPQLSYLGLYGTSVTALGIKDIVQRKNITSFSFTPTEITDEFLYMLYDCGMLHRLSRAEGKDGTRPSSQDEIVSLNLRDTKVTNAGLKRLPALKRLTTLRANNWIRGDGLREIACLKNLTALKSAGSQGFADSDMKGIAGFSELTSLSLFGMRVTDAAMMPVGKMPMLAKLDLEYTGVTDQGLKELAGLPSLSVLNLRLTSVSDVGLQHLRGCTNITELDLIATKVTDAGLEHLLSFKKLTKLQLGDVSDAGLKELASLNNLTHLRLGASVTDAGMKHLAAHKNLAILDLTHTKVTASGLKELAGSSKLQELYLGDSANQDQSLLDLK